MERTRGQLEVALAHLAEAVTMLEEAERSAEDLRPGLRSLYRACVRCARADIGHIRGDSLEMARALLEEDR